jgi:DNA-directed RNA polymerase specialized sigma24 family protein
VSEAAAPDFAALLDRAARGEQAAMDELARQYEPKVQSGVLTALSNPGTDPAADAQFRDQVEHLCAHLDETERLVLDPRLEGHTLAEIADLLGVNRIALRVRLTRLRQRLQAAGVVSDWL